MTHTVAVSGSAAALRGVSFGALLARVACWTETAKQRRALARLSPDQLRDIGLERGVASFEAERPFWEPTSTGR